ncbi:uncharacterized protein HMPREF1541_10523 [Cyphellophora europaea CBS 101466]|uniref:Cytochrome P450 n=1 Tax=Cyphellophora europaea (strain CBS 101466) TaxID=1220924 RepID=W2S8H0_CYPE1|nr:uncharacterized protein HMPREF1541_10523 [Cyphellophora europaea CBS 101466]ETN44343.1 hypothetical protein HMPREF1541_10523 [Cyphellophora europaea CBS 101466]
MGRLSHTLPLLGNAIRFLQPRHVLFSWFVDQQARYGDGTYEISVPSLPPGVVISSPANLEFVLKNETLVTKGDFFRSRAWDLFGHGIINATGPVWRAQRKAGLRFFSGTTLEALVDDVLPELYHDVENTLLAAFQSGETLDLQRVFHDLTTSIMGLMAYDMHITSAHPFSQAFNHASAHIASRFQNPLYPLTELFSGGPFRRAVREVKRFGLSIVTTAKKRRGHEAFASLLEGTETPHFGTLIDSLIESLDSDPTLVADAAMNFLSAGRDTTAESLTWTFYALLRHPAALARLESEIRAAFPPNNTKEEVAPITMAGLQPAHIPYVMAVFYEALRLYPPVPIEIQQAAEPLTLPDGTHLPRGAVLVWCIWALNRSHKLYGPDPEAFRPERWLDDATGRFVPPRDNWVFPVFNGGPRACLGRKMAEVLACWVLVRVVSEWQFREVGMQREDGDGLRERVSGLSLTLPMEGGLPVKVMRQRRRKGGGGVEANLERSATGNE